MRKFYRLSWRKKEGMGPFFDAIMEGLEPDAILCYSKSLFLVNFTIPTFSRKKAKHIKIFLFCTHV